MWRDKVGGAREARKSRSGERQPWHLKKQSGRSEFVSPDWGHIKPNDGVYVVKVKGRSWKVLRLAGRVTKRRAV